jgi:hypothetical protein
MRLLVAISSCEYYENKGLNDPQRNTWLVDAVKLGMDYKFFHGKGSTPKEDVIVLDVDDGMGGVTDKQKGKLEWAYNNGYDYVFSCYPDTYACASRLLSCGFNNFDYLGYVHQHPGGNPYCQGGCGYFLSRKAYEIAYRATTSYVNDDCWMGDTLLAAGIRPTNNNDFTNCGPGPKKDNTSITVHLSTQPGGYVGTNMYNEHNLWLESLV